MYAQMGRKDADTLGNGDCLLYAVLGLTVANSAYSPVESAHLAHVVRAMAVAHASSMPLELQRRLGLADHARDAAGRPVYDTRGVPLTVLQAQSARRAFMTDAILPSLATCIGVDIAVVLSDQAGTQQPFLHVYRQVPDTEAAAASSQLPIDVLPWDPADAEFAALFSAAPALIHSDLSLHYRTSVSLAGGWPFHPPRLRGLLDANPLEAGEN
ncbi:hypothetical protein T492DRAFT_1104202 [Pavlovales sp. CCMP2436]|nr:hypothetical protein T492DRAFT_1104202 [Pavlovales sp. CCMP2436]